MCIYVLDILLDNQQSLTLQRISAPFQIISSNCCHICSYFYHSWWTAGLSQSSINRTAILTWPSVLYNPNSWVQRGQSGFISSVHSVVSASQMLLNEHRSVTVTLEHFFFLITGMNHRQHGPTLVSILVIQITTTTTSIFRCDMKIAKDVTFVTSTCLVYVLLKLEHNLNTTAHKRQYYCIIYSII